MFKSERRKHVVGRGVLTRKDMAILMRDQSNVNEKPIKRQGVELAKHEAGLGTKERVEKVAISREPQASTSGDYFVY